MRASEAAGSEHESRTGVRFFYRQRYMGQKVPHFGFFRLWNFFENQFTKGPPHDIFVVFSEDRTSFSFNSFLSVSWHLTICFRDCFLPNSPI